MRIVRHKKGQFIIIAAMLLSIMIISISTVIYGTVTYYRQERWEEYVTVLDNLRTSSGNIVQIALANYSLTSDPNVLRDYFNQWIRDARKAYPGLGVDLSFSLAQGMHSAYGVSLNYNLGLNRTWNQPVSFSASNATLNLDLVSIGLTGYNFSSHAFLKMRIRGAEWFYKESKRYVSIYVSVEREDSEPVINLQKSNFPDVKLGGVSRAFSVKRYYSSTYSSFIYEIRVNSIAALPPSAEVTLVDTRGIKTVSYTTAIVLNGS